MTTQSGTTHTDTDTTDVTIDLEPEPPAFDAAKAEAFAGHMLDTLNKGLACLLVSMGNRLGLFDTLAGTGPSTSAELAGAAGLDERYVREWLATMATSRIVGYDGERFSIPAEHAAFLTHAAGPTNLALFAEFAPILASVHDEIEDCFRNGGGIGYEYFVPFHRYMSEASGAVFDATLLEVTLRLVDGLVESLEAGIDVLDVGCGSGHAINLMGSRFPNSRFVGLDFSPPAIEAARAEAERLGLDNVRFDLADARNLSDEGTFGLVTTFDAVHDQADPALVLSNIRRALAPDGVYLAVDIAASSDLAENLDHPLGSFFYAVSTMHCMTVSLSDDGAGLGTMWGHQLATRMFGEAGFESVDVKHVDGDMVNTYYICRPGT